MNAASSTGSSDQTAKGQPVEVLTATEEDSTEWDEYVYRHEQCVNYHRWGWRRVIEKAFRWKSCYLMAKENGQLCGILPLAENKSRIFGHLLCSLPFFSEAGIVADSPAVANALADEAVRVAERAGAEYVELRHGHETALSWPAKTNKVTLVCDVFADAEENMQHLSTKMRTNVRRSLRSGLGAEFGGREFLDDFYEIFCRKMRELGTPPYGKRFFELILNAFPHDAFVCRVRHSGKTVGAAFLTGYRDSIEANWSACASDAMSLRPNMFLFWELLCFAGRKGYRTFDFGRSSIESGTYRFKQQWNTRVVPLSWNYWSKAGEQALELNPNNPRYRAAIWAWKHLPLSVTKLVGPAMARCLP
jgi:FemAB-related protein (PEP-CTERM system-associated)